MKNFFGNIKWAQILAGALAAVTSFLLMNQIGIAGSLIGAGVASIVTALATQIYQSVIDESHDKMREQLAGKKGDAQDGVAEGDASKSKDSARAGSDEGKGPARTVIGTADDAAGDDRGEVTGLEDLAEGSEDADVEADGTVALASVATPEDTLPSAGGAGDDAKGAEPEVGLADISAADVPTQVLPEAVKRAAVRASLEKSPLDDRAAGDAATENERKAKSRRRMFVVALVSALIAVAITSVVILMLTGGAGLGSKPNGGQPAPQVTQNVTQSTVVTLYTTTSNESETEPPAPSRSGESTTSASATASTVATATGASSPSAVPDASASATANPSQTATSSADSVTDSGNSDAAASESASPSTNSAQ